MTVGVVTGAASGMGRACVDRLRGTVDHLLAVDLRAPDLDGTVGVACDVSDPDAVRALAARVAELGPFRSLVHAAGLSPTMAEPRRIVEVNLVGTVMLLDAFEPLVDRRLGRGVLLVELRATCRSRCSARSSPSSCASRVPTTSSTGRALLLDHCGLAYAWSKKGVQLEAEAAAVRWGPLGGRVVSVSPGLIDTPMGRQEFEQQPIMQEILDDDAARSPSVR